MTQLHTARALWAAPPRRPGLIERRIQIVQEVVAAHYGLNARALASLCKVGRYTWPRQVAMALARRVVGRSWEEIGAAFAGRSHSTVLRSAEKVEGRCRSFPYLAAQVGGLEVAARAAIVAAEGGRPDA